MKWLFKWALRIVVLAVVAVVLLLVFKDSIVRVITEHRIRAATGMDVKIGRISSGLLSPVVTIEDLKLYNTPEFGGTEFLVVPELHVEFDANALAGNKLRIKLLRCNVAEVDVVRNQSGQTNLVTMLAKMPKGKLAPHGIHVGGRKLEFEGIDVLNLTVGRARFIDLKNRAHDHETVINLDNQVFNNVKTDTDFSVAMAIIWLRAGGPSFLSPQDFSGNLLNHKPTRAPDPIERPKPAPAHN
jgi:uncharacterized protein involved in outer membrane biogenesis